MASRNAKIVCDQGLGVGETGLAVYLDFRDAIARDGKDVISAKYGNLFDMYANIAGENPYTQPDAYFSSCTLHDGWSLGRLQLNDQYTRSVCCWRSQFLGSWR